MNSASGLSSDIGFLLRQNKDRRPLRGACPAPVKAASPGRLLPPVTREPFGFESCFHCTTCPLLSRHAARVGARPFYRYRPAQRHRRGRQAACVRGLARPLGNDPAARPEPPPEAAAEAPARRGGGLHGR